MTTAPDDDTPRCVKCRSRLWDSELLAGRWACQLCEDNATKQLAALPGPPTYITERRERRITGGLYAALAAHLRPGSHSSAGPVTGSRDKPLGLSLATLDFRGPGGMVTELQFIEDSWRRTLRLPPAPFRGTYDQTLTGVVTFLLGNIKWMCGHDEEIGGDLETIGRIHGRALAIVTGSRPQRTVKVTCPCGGTLAVTLDTDGRRCPGCGEQYGWTELRKLPLAERSAA